MPEGSVYGSFPGRGELIEDLSLTFCYRRVKDGAVRSGAVFAKSVAEKQPLISW